jgi:hypothetical protein
MEPRTKTLFDPIKNVSNMKQEAQIDTKPSSSVKDAATDKKEIDFTKID